MGFLLIDLLSALLGLAVTLLFFGTLWTVKNTKLHWVVLGIIILAISNVIVVPILQSTPLLPAVSIVLSFMLSLYFMSRLLMKVLFSLVSVAISFAAELFLAFIIVNILDVSIGIEHSDVFLYFVGVILSNMIALIIVVTVRIIMKGYKSETGGQFNFIMLLMPIQSIVICFVVYFYSVTGDYIEVSLLGLSAIFVSISLVFISMFMIRSLQKAIAYKADYEQASERLNIQLKEYQKLYREQTEIRKIRHDISNNFIALIGTLEDGRVKEAIGRMRSISANINKPDTLIDTGVPEIDAVINAKVDKAANCNIHVVTKVKFKHELNVNAYDLAGIIANALDNAIEGIMRSNDIEKNIFLNIRDTTNFISVICENYASGFIYDNFQTTKHDKANHGFGMKQMSDVVLKYGGDFQPEYDKKSRKFLLKILLKNRKI